MLDRISVYEPLFCNVDQNLLAFMTGWVQFNFLNLFCDVVENSVQWGIIANGFLSYYPTRISYSILGKLR